MTYLQIVNVVITVLSAIMALLSLHFFFFGIIGVFKKKTFPETGEKLRYGVIIPARNEEAVVGGLIESVFQCNYPQDKLQVFVIAHNCTDATARVAREAGATVYEYNNPDERTMGYAFRYLFDRIREDYGVESYDGFFLFNADNILDINYFDKMNDAFVANDKKCVVTSYRNSKNFGTNVMSAMYGLYFLYGCCYESRGRTVMGCSTRVQGTGYVINSELVKDGWKYVTLTEDWEFTADQILRDSRIVFCNDAVFYDEQPTTFKVMWRQRLRWARGHLLVCLSRLKEIVVGLFRPRSRGGNDRKFSTYDIMVNVLPFCVIGFCVFLLQWGLSMLAPLFGGPPLKVIVLNLLRSAGIGLLFSYVTLVLASVVLFVMERHRIPQMKFRVKLFATLLWPFFLLLSTPLEIVALFSKNLGWKPIPHTDTTRFSHFNRRRRKKAQEKETKE